MIVILDNDLGNSGSVLKMVKLFDDNVIITSDPNQIKDARKIILPGVGSFDTGMLNIKKSKFLSVLEEKVLKEKIPFLGICLGMQMLFEQSDEGNLNGLGWIPGQVKRFEFNKNITLKIPHMGWNTVNQVVKNNLLPENVEELRYYFVHSYHAVCKEEYIIAKTFYGYDFACAVQNENIFGTQFHPEKSHRFGKALIEKFVKL